jgi:hypothetical protein
LFALIYWSIILRVLIVAWALDLRADRRIRNPQRQVLNSKTYN